MEVEIRPLSTHDELHACEELQRGIWGFQEASVVPHHLLLTAQGSGGVLLGAFDRGRLVGFIFSFPGLEGGRLKHCSLMTGVHPGRRFAGVGTALKRAQREQVLAQGIELVTWTFDPLQSANAHFNLAKLGAIARVYERNLYGDLRDELNRGLPTDRLTAEWWLKSPRVAARMEGGTGRAAASVAEAPRVNRTRMDGGRLVNREVDLGRDEERLLVEIPRDINRLKAEDPELARRWRLVIRGIFEGYFEQGYVASGLVTREEGGRPRSYYLLERAPLEALLGWERRA